MRSAFAWIPTLALVGCAGAPHPFAGGVRDDGLRVDPSPLRLALRVPPADRDAALAAVTAAVAAAGGGEVRLLDGPARARLLRFARSAPGAALDPGVASYEASFVARLADSLAPMTVLWCDGTRVPVGGDEARLLDLGTNEYQLLLTPRRPLRAPAALLYPDEGGYRFKRAPFRLLLRRTRKPVPLRITTERATLRPEDRLLFVEVRGFAGSVDELLASLLAADHPGTPGPLRFSLRDAHLWLDVRTATPTTDAEEDGEAVAEATEDAPADGGQAH